MAESQDQRLVPSREAGTSSLASFSNSSEKWIQLLFQRGPLGVLAAGGAMALWKGLLPTFEIREAIFGAILLVLAAVADMFVWIAKRQAARRRYEGTEKALQDAAQEVTHVDATSPTDRAYGKG